MGNWNGPVVNKVLSFLWAVITAPARGVVWLGVHAFGYHIALNPSDVDGVSVLTFFAGLLTTQAAALVILAQGKSSEFVIGHLAIYVGFALLPLLGIVFTVLRKKAIDPTNQAETRAYREQTVSFGRWTLLYGLILTALLPFLGWRGWIPGQKNQIEYAESFIPTAPVQADYIRELKKHTVNAAVQKWVNEIARGKEKNLIGGQKLLLIEQDGSFHSDYRSFVTAFSFTGNALATGGDCFLVQGGHEVNSSPTFRTLPLLPSNKVDPATINRHVVNIRDPAENDFLVLFLVVEQRNTGQGAPAFPDKDGSKYGFKWVVDQ